MKSLFRLVLALSISCALFTGCSKPEEDSMNEASNLKAASINEACYLKVKENYVTGDFHQHSTFTDGSFTLGHVMSRENKFGLDWWANSEHGGGFATDGRTSGIDLNQTIYWDQMEDVSILGTVSMSGSHQIMWRWQSLRDFSFPFVLEQRMLYPHKTIIQGYEWNVPGHEHGSVGIIAGEFGRNANANAIAEFEYKFDNSDTDIIGGAAQGWVKSTNNGHTKTLEGIKWLQTNYRKSSWVVPAHPERKKLYKINDFRDMNNAGPDVCFGFESMPGHQKESGRGGYSSSADGGGTYGGCGIYAAKVGGLWDAMLSEGRGFWLFANSDFHNEDGDFYPGEYQKTYVAVSNKKDPQAIVDGLRSGNAWVVTGDLIDALDFKVNGKKMGERANVNGNKSKVTVIVHDPSTKNNNIYGGSVNPELNHIDLIAGKITGKIAAGTADYSVPSVNTTKIIARFDAVGGIIDSKGIVSQKWQDLGQGWKKMELNVSNISEDTYFRLRGTNLDLNVPNQTDSEGNPLADSLLGPNNAEKAFADLWFYSNPIFVKK